MPQDGAFLFVPLKILKMYLTVGVDGIVYLIYAVIDSLIACFDSAAQYYLSVKLCGFITACQTFKLFYKLFRFLFGNEFGGLN